MYLDSILFNKHLEDDETLSLIVHKHWLMGIKNVLWPLVLFLALWGSLYVIPHKLWFYAVSVSSVLLLVWAARNFFDYYMDAWLITDQGVIDLEWHGWFHRQSARVLYSDIQGVSTEVSGICATILRYGTVTVEKISTGSTINLPYAPHPRSIETRILKCMESYLHDRNLKNAKHIQDLLSDFVSQSVQEKSLRKTEVKVSSELPIPSPAPAKPTRPTKKSFTSTRI